MKPYKLPADYLEYSAFQKHSELLTIPTPKPMDVVGIPDMARNISYLYTEWNKGYPLYCVRKNLLQAMLQTDVGEKLELFTDIKLSIPFYTLFLPRYQLKSALGNAYLDYIIINQYQLDLPEHKYAVVWGGVDSKNNLFLSSKRIRRDGTLQVSAFNTDDKEVQTSALTVRNVVLQSVLLLQYYPEIAEQMQRLPQKGKGFAKADPLESRFRLPRWLGQEKKTYHQESRGTGVGKGFHWRRGFYREQPYGEGRQLRKVIWIEPTKVNSYDT